jgi:hypothetical protein
MKVPTLAAGLAFAVLTGLGLGGLAVADAQVPFKGSFEGYADASAFPAVVLHLTGRASQLGQFTFVEPHVVTPPTGVGTFEFVASNGDTIFGTATGTATPTDTPNVLSIEAHATITGGTGRFAGATGSFTGVRLYDRATGWTAGTFEGSVSAPGAGD